MPEDHRVKLKEREKGRQILEPSLRTEKLSKQECDRDTNCSPVKKFLITQKRDSDNTIVKIN